MRRELCEERLLCGFEYMNLGTRQNLQGDYDGALANFHRARSHFEEVGDLARLADAHCRCGFTCLAKQSLDAAVREFESASFLAARICDLRLEGLATFGKASTYFRRGDLRMALSLGTLALRRLLLVQERTTLADAYILHAMIYSTMKELENSDMYLYKSYSVGARHRVVRNVTH